MTKVEGEGVQANYSRPCQSLLCGCYSVVVITRDFEVKLPETQVRTLVAPSHIRHCIFMLLNVTYEFSTPSKQFIVIIIT